MGLIESEIKSVLLAAGLDDIGAVRLIGRFSARPVVVVTQGALQGDGPLVLADGSLHRLEAARAAGLIRAEDLDEIILLAQ